MIAAITSLISLMATIGGALIRALPEIIQLVETIFKWRHEYRMETVKFQRLRATLQPSVDKQIVLSAQESDEKAQGLILETYKAAMEAQSRPTGIKSIDAINSAVRPFCLGWWMLIFTAYKFSLIIHFWTTTTSWSAFGQGFWTESDRQILGMMIGFFFVERATKHIKEHATTRMLK